MEATFTTFTERACWWGRLPLLFCARPPATDTPPHGAANSPSSGALGMLWAPLLGPQPAVSLATFQSDADYHSFKCWVPQSPYPEDILLNLLVWAIFDLFRVWLHKCSLLRVILQRMLAGVTDTTAVTVVLYRGQACQWAKEPTPWYTFKVQIPLPTSKSREKEYCKMGVTSTNAVWLKWNSSVLNQEITISCRCKFNFYSALKVTWEIVF